MEGGEAEAEAEAEGEGEGEHEDEGGGGAGTEGERKGRGREGGARPEAEWCMWRRGVRVQRRKLLCEASSAALPADAAKQIASKVGSDSRLLSTPIIESTPMPRRRR